MSQQHRSSGGGSPAHASESGLLVEIRQAGQLVGQWRLGAAPVEIVLRDGTSGDIMGTFTARGPASSGVDEAPVPRVSPRQHGDDFTMPLPEPTQGGPEPTGDLYADEPETETAEAPLPARSRARVPNLARQPDTDEHTSPSVAERGHTHIDLGRSESPRATSELSPTDDGDDEVSRTRPRAPLYNAVGDFSLGQDEHTLGADLLTDGMSEGDATVGHLLTEDGPGSEPAVAGIDVPPAEVWLRNATEWRSASRLRPGERTTARQGWVELDARGRLRVMPGPELSGTATLADGQTHEIRAGSGLLMLPPGASVILRGPGHGIYVRADPPVHAARR